MSGVQRAANEIQQLADLAIARANDPRNVRKGEWPHSRRKLFWLLLVEVGELFGALVVLWLARWRHDRYRVQYVSGSPSITQARREYEKARSHVEHEAGDCAAFLAFLVSRISGGSEPPSR